MRQLHFAVSHRRKGTKQAPATAHVRYITRAHEGAAAHVGYVTRTTQTLREDLVATQYGNLPQWAGDDPVHFFQAADEWERANGRTATQITAALPRGLGRGEMIAIVDTFVQSQLGTSHAYVWGIHETTASDGGTYPHVHIAFSERPTRDDIRKERHFSVDNPKNVTFDRQAWPYAARQAWSDACNVVLEASGLPERVSARSFRDQGVEWEAGRYVPRHEWHEEKRKAEGNTRRHSEDTPEALAKRTQEWDARKRYLGLAPTQTQQRTVTPEASETRDRGPVIGNRNSQIYHHTHHKNYGDIHPKNQVHFDSAAHAEAAGYRRARNDQYGEGTGQALTLAEVQALRQAEAHYVQHPGQLRSPAHTAAVARVLHEEEPPTMGRRRHRARWEQDEDQGRGRTHDRAD